jgi:hypothetical protein
VAAGPPDDVDEGPLADDLGQPVLGRGDDVQPGVGQRLGGPLRVLLGDQEVGVVVGFGRTADPRRVATAQGEGHSLLLERDGRSLEKVADLVPLRWLHRPLLPPAPRRTNLGR